MSRPTISLLGSSAGDEVDRPLDFRATSFSLLICLSKSRAFSSR